MRQQRDVRSEKLSKMTKRNLEYFEKRKTQTNVKPGA